MIQDWTQKSHPRHHLATVNQHYCVLLPSPAKTHFVSDVVFPVNTNQN